MVTDPKCYDSRNKKCRFWIPRFSSCKALSESYDVDGQCPFFKELDGYQEANEIDERNKKGGWGTTPIQSAIDSFLLAEHPSSVFDMRYVPEDHVVVVYRRKIGQKSMIIDVSGCITPSEVMDRILQNPVFSGYPRCRA